MEIERDRGKDRERETGRLRGTETGPEAGSDVKVSLVFCLQQFMHSYPVIWEN